MRTDYGRRSVTADDRLNGEQRVHLPVAHAAGGELGRRLHRDQAQQLEEVVLHHVAQRARAVVVVGPASDADRLVDRDLHVVDVRGVPQRLEQGVREAQDQQVLHRLLAEVVVDAEDLLLREDGTDLVVDLPGGREVLADGLLQHDPRPRVNQAVLRGVL